MLDLNHSIQERSLDSPSMLGKVSPLERCGGGDSVGVLHFECSLPRGVDRSGLLLDMTAGRCSGAVTVALNPPFGVQLAAHSGRIGSIAGKVAQVV